MLCGKFGRLQSRLCVFVSESFGVCLVFGVPASGDGHHYNTQKLFCLMMVLCETLNHVTLSCRVPNS